MTSNIFDITRYAFNSLSVQTLVTALGVFGLGIFALIREKGSQRSVAFFLLTQVVAIWLFCFSWMYSAADVQVAMWWAKAAYLGVGFIPAAIYYYSGQLWGDAKFKKRSPIILAVSTVFVLAIITTNILFESLHHYSWGFYPKYSLTSIPFLLYFFGVMTGVIRHHWEEYRRTTKGSIRRVLARTVLITFAIAYIASFDYLAAFGIPLYPFGYIPILVYIVLSARAIVRYELLSITPAVAANQIINTMHDALIVLDQEGIIRLVNQATCSLLGYSEQDLVGKRPSVSMTNDMTFARVLESFVQGDMVRNYEVDCRTKKGPLHILSLTTSILRGRTGEQLAIVCVARDITESKRTEEVLIRNDRLLRRAEQIAKFGSWEFILNENRVNASEGARSIYGLETGEWSISEVQRIPLPKYRQMLDRALKGLIEHGVPYNVEFKICRPSDEEIIDINAIAEYDATRNVVFGVIQDITERVRAEKEKDALQTQLLEAQKMESVGRLAGGVAHDFNNILTSILGHTDLAMMHSSPSERIHADLKAIEKSALRSVELVRLLLAFARRQPVAPIVLDLNDRVTGMLIMLQRLIGEDIDLVWRPGAGLWPIKIDPSQVDQLLANLCVNSRDAIEGVGKVTIKTENAMFDEDYCAIHSGFVCGEYVMLAVCDDGIGMNEEVLDHLFEPFFTTKEVGRGTGLGLATVYGIVKQNEGFINVKSDLGHGSTFKIFLPRCAGETIKSATAETEHALKGRGETVLLVEDETAILSVGKAMLEALGYTVLTANTPGEALSQAQAHRDKIQLLITDLIMPEMNGLELAKLIDEIKPGLKYLFTSGYTADVIAHRGVLDEGLHFLQKPFSLKALASKVHEVLEQ